MDLNFLKIREGSNFRGLLEWLSLGLLWETVGLSADIDCKS